MTAIHIRPANASDAPVVVRFLRHMLDEMVAVGGHAVSQREEDRTCFADEIGQCLADQGTVCLLAESPCDGPLGYPLGCSQVATRARYRRDTPPGQPVGVVLARVSGREGVYLPQKELHVSAVYVIPACRRQGIGRTLLEAALDCGRQRGCAEVELNVLVGNPACALYEALGFRPFEIEMRRKL
jgi:ribosomal protein S18 acetylase RimI-like enzyme